MSKIIKDDLELIFANYAVKNPKKLPAKKAEAERLLKMGGRSAARKQQLETELAAINKVK